MERYLRGEAIGSGFNDEIDSLEKFKLNSANIEPETNSSSGFECNICLDLVQDPVVTFCGHLYCWPCIYRWMNSHYENPDNQRPKCPVCKTEVSQKTLIPLYGRGQTSDPSTYKDRNIIVPHRPTTPLCNNMSIPANYRYPSYAQPSEFDQRLASSPLLGIGSGGSTHLADPMIWMFGEMVYARIFGNSETALHTYPNSYHLAGGSNPRLRRHMMQTDTSLSRVCFFLCCCVMLCLILF